ncbi:hypothetical protein EUBSIR_01105 [[Eubacterium] siraeum DSM 15702]|uniref:Uncharacterized protein n=1 Tax=[Eubacterium] siraeum DSM 15702 TaxID=428128 RepID=B0MMU6_9FIRM|nr:hypothetical protein EUBSIR_01105 [[Eubacterium] siraeum DSM 15702]
MKTAFQSRLYRLFYHSEMKKAIIFKKHLKNTDKCAIIILLWRFYATR